MVHTKAKIMVLEDEQMLLRAIGTKLAHSGYDVVSCTSANQALDYLNSMDEPPDAIWLDYYLGEMSGLDFMHKLTNNERWKQIPVIVVSNSASREKREAMLNLGAKLYLLKAEHKLGDIVEIIGDLLRKGGDDKN